MRDAFVRALTEIARSDKQVFLLTADLGFGVLSEFARAFPRQYLNVGVAEQNMTGLATGIALEGKIVFTYSIGNFPTLRCLEQIRNDVCYHQANVKIVSIGGGFCYGPLGISHHATEDIAIMRALPNMKVVAPGDLTETSLATRTAYEVPGPFYLRLGRGNEPNVHDDAPSFHLGRCIGIHPGGEIALLSTGGILKNAVEARRMLEEKGIRASLFSMPFLKPIDSRLIGALALKTRLLVTIEEHSVIGGLGGAVAEVLSGLRDPRPPLLRLGLEDTFSCEVGDQEYLRGVYGLSPEAISARVEKEIASLQISKEIRK